MMFYETSASTGHNVTKAFIDLSEKLIIKKESEEDDLDFLKEKPG